jgi:hypothetical protein
MVSRLCRWTQTQRYGGFKWLGAAITQIWRGCVGRRVAFFGRLVATTGERALVSWARGDTSFGVEGTKSSVPPLRRKGGVRLASALARAGSVGGRASASRRSGLRVVGNLGSCV